MGLSSVLLREPLECRECSKQFSSASMYAQHSVIHQLNKNFKFQCPMCIFESTSQRGFETHFSRAHKRAAASQSLLYDGVVSDYAKESLTVPPNSVEFKELNISETVYSESEGWLVLRSEHGWLLLLVGEVAGLFYAGENQMWCS